MTHYLFLESLPTVADNIVCDPLLYGTGSGDQSQAYKSPIFLWSKPQTHKVSICACVRFGPLKFNDLDTSWTPLYYITVLEHPLGYEAFLARLGHCICTSVVIVTDGLLPVYLRSCKIKSGNGLGMRLGQAYIL